MLRLVLSAIRQQPGAKGSQRLSKSGKKTCPPKRWSTRIITVYTTTITPITTLTAKCRISITVATPKHPIYPQAENKEGLSEKKRLRRAETRLLPFPAPSQSSLATIWQIFNGTRATPRRSKLHQLQHAHPSYILYSIDEYSYPDNLETGIVFDTSYTRGAITPKGHEKEGGMLRKDSDA
ncbi:uncharacterized protein CC84DRAFT_794476 [Paraphaeosphaeria sporulosa]|uniref:Uncharacterized protein n=1 Tax=Paraphaeosphaeria sporulosa TaxID=1460663 RepID=A0A177CCH5_9PLEO|nr:uncharacterized protein CC84DRAFT_794476 [Paraphaeosphaeria sporulosa]OAG04507.1 hypothetical protein CC84DRAFT_794476 [Paraphaeosphaeria sporulosa]